MRTRAHALARLRRALLCAGILVALGACDDYPRDVRGTLDRVEGGILRVGVAHHPPWICLHTGRRDIEAGEMAVGGIEAALLEQWARQLGARIEWIPGAESDLVAALDEDVVDIAAAGFTPDSAWRRHVAFSRPYANARLMLVKAGAGRAEAGQAALGQADRQLAFQSGRLHVAAAIRQAGAIPSASAAPLSSLPAVVYDFELPEGAPHAALHSAPEEQRVLAVAQGESAFLLALDRFLGAGTRLDGATPCDADR